MVKTVMVTQMSHLVPLDLFFLFLYRLLALVPLGRIDFFSALQDHSQSSLYSPLSLCWTYTTFLYWFLPHAWRNVATSKAYTSLYRDVNLWASFFLYSSFYNSLMIRWHNTKVDHTAKSMFKKKCLPGSHHIELSFFHFLKDIVRGCVFYDVIHNYLLFSHTLPIPLYLMM